MKDPFQIAEGFDAPHGSNIIWRYMGLEKFLDFLEKSVLRFSQASMLSDSRELRLPYERLDAINRRINIREQLKNSEIIELDDGREEGLRKAQQRAEHLRNCTYLNSWSIAQSESYALWKIYLGSNQRQSSADEAPPEEGNRHGCG